VSVGLNVVGHVIIDDQGHIRHVNAPTSHISSNQHIVGVLLETFDGDLTANDPGKQTLLSAVANEWFETLLAQRGCGDGIVRGEPAGKLHTELVRQQMAQPPGDILCCMRIARDQKQG
jgi:hypothetical protein